MALIHLDPARYRGVVIGTLTERPAHTDVPQNTVFMAVDEHAIYVNQDGWSKVADLTGAIPWDQILNKPAAFPPEIHDLEDGHSGYLSIRRMRGHDMWDPEHLLTGLQAQVIGMI